jgi:hypothetical protein
MLSFDNLLCVQRFASWETAICLARAMKSPGAVHATFTHPHRPDHVDALFGDDDLLDDLMVNDMFIPLQKCMVLWTILPRKRAMEIFDKMIGFLERRKPSEEALYSRRGGPYVRNAFPCLKDLMTYKGEDLLLRRLQYMAYERVCALRLEGIGDIVRTLLMFVSQKNDALRDLLHSLAATNPDLFENYLRLAVVMKKRRKHVCADETRASRTSGK